MHGTEKKRIWTFIILIGVSCLSVTTAMKQFSVAETLKLSRKENKNKQSNNSSNHERVEIGSDVDTGTSDVLELYLDQRLDHFSSHPSGDKLVPHSFQQRYFYTARFTNEVTESKQKNGYPSEYNNNLRHKQRTGFDTTESFVFICVGGEGPSLDKTVLTDSPHCSGDMLALAGLLAAEKNANIYVFALEHRYYGKSYPEFKDGSSPVTNENLAYLSSRQALADLAHFTEFIKDEYQIGDVPVVTFGGSYPGMLAAWSRSKYPHLIHAAVSNSAPIKVILDFSEYMNVYARSMSNPVVGGSQLCLDLIHEGHEEIAAMLSKGGQDENEYIASVFNICDGSDALKDPKSVNSFLGDGVVFFDVQSNDPSCEEEFCSIGKFCDFITEESDTTSTPIIEILAKLSNATHENDCKDISWERMISFLSSPDAIAEGTRSWLYQTCTEVGFYQTCEANTACPFARGYHTLDADYEICERAFGINRDYVKQNVEDTLTYYGGWNISASRILSVNGDIDPWSAMSLSNSDNKSSNGELPVIWSNSSSHHYWTHQIQKSDGEVIMHTRSLIYNWVTKVLYGEESTFTDTW